MSSLIGVAVLMFAPHLLAKNLVFFSFGHSQMIWIDSFTKNSVMHKFFSFLLLWGPMKKIYTHEKWDMEEEDWLGTLPFILSLKRLHKGIIGSYHLCNAIIIYTFALCMRVDNFRKTGKLALVDEYMLVRVLRATDVKWFKWLIKIAIWVSCVSAILTPCFNAYTMLQHSPTGTKIFAFILWSWYFPVGL